MWRQQWLLADGVARTWHAPVGENPVFPGQRGRSLVVKPQSSKLMMRVRFSSPAPNPPPVKTQVRVITGHCRDWMFDLAQGLPRGQLDGIGTLLEATDPKLGARLSAAASARQRRIFRMAASY